ncbi:MAG: hypothetical protein ACE5GV_02080 [Candidatus Scalindua sp.]
MKQRMPVFQCRIDLNTKHGFTYWIKMTDYKIKRYHAYTDEELISGAEKYSEEMKTIYVSIKEKEPIEVSDSLLDMTC